MLVLLALAAAQASPLPPCVTRAEGQPTRAALAPLGEDEAVLLGRLVYAEATSTGFPDDDAVHRAIAWGVVNRVRLAEASRSAARSYGRGVDGVIFAPGQFNPAVSVRSRFSRDFLCPTDEGRWTVAADAAREALARRAEPTRVPTPIGHVRAPWELRHGIDLAVNFYYPSSEQARGPEAPWERSPQLERLDLVLVDGVALPAERVTFYRLTRPPGDAR